MAAAIPAIPLPAPLVGTQFNKHYSTVWVSSCEYSEDSWHSGAAVSLQLHKMPSRAQSKLTGGNEVGLYRPAIHVRWLYVYSRRGWKSGQKNLFLHVFLRCFRKTIIRQKLTVFKKIFGQYRISDATIYRPNDISSRYWPYRIVSISSRKILNFWDRYRFDIVSISAKRRRCWLFFFFFVGNKSRTAHI